MLFSMLIALLACGEPAVDDTGFCWAGDPVEAAETPPLPGDACEDPPTTLSSLLEVAVGAGLDASDELAEQLFDPDTVTVLTCGTGSPVPSDRAQSCVAVFAGGQFLLFDAGDGAQRSMESQQLPMAEVDAVFLTHFHSDHMADLGEVISRSWILGRTHELPIHGGPGIDRLVEGFTLAYSPDVVYRVAHHGPDVFPVTDMATQAVEVDVEAAGTRVYEQDGVEVYAYGVDHAPVAPSLGYRITYAGLTVAISGDSVDSEGFQALAQGADVLVSEVIEQQFALDTACAMERLEEERTSQIFRDIRTYHIGLDELGALATAAEVDTLVLTHMVPNVTGTQAETFFGEPMRERFDGEVVLAEDDTWLTLEVQ